jgi:3-dehydroquinate synthase
LAERQGRLLTALGLPTVLRGVDQEAVLAAMARDKKVEHGQLKFVLPTELGHVESVGSVPPEAVRAVLTAPGGR